MAEASRTRSADGSAVAEPIPVLLAVHGWRCVVVGAGVVGTGRALSLAEAGAEVTVVAPEASANLAEAAQQGLLDWQVRPFEDTDLQGARLVVAATDDADINARVAAAAPADALLSRSDDFAAGRVGFMGTLRRGPVRLAADTAGRSPAMSAWVLRRLARRWEDLVGLDDAALTLLVDLLGELRAAERAARVDREGDEANVTREGRDWSYELERCMLDAVLLDLIRAGRRDEAKERLRACLS